MSAPPGKTNAVRLLDTLGVVYELRAYTVAAGDLSAESVASKLGLPAAQVFKTLVARGARHGVCLAVVPGDRELDLKALAQARGEKAAQTVALREVQPLTGYWRGGVTALACRTPFPVYLDTSALDFARMAVSAGLRGLQVLLDPRDYRRATGAQVLPLAKPKRG